MIYLASDHAGYQLKNEIAAFLKQKDIPSEDLGPFKYDESDDFPDYIFPAAKKVSEDPERNKAIILGGSGQGEAMAANKVPGVRATVYYGGTLEIIELSRIHNNANVLSLGARFVTKEIALEAIALWLETAFPAEERHARRIEKMSRMEKEL